MSRHTPLLALAVAAVALGLAGCKSAPLDRPIPMGPIKSGPGSLQEARVYLQGRWSLVSFEVYPPGKAPIILKGNGTMTFDDFGNLKMEIRTDRATADLLDAAGIAMKGETISSEGRVVIDMQGHKLTYVMPGQPPAGQAEGPLALSRPRYWEADGDLLTLSTRDDNGRSLSVGTWRKQR